MRLFNIFDLDFKNILAYLWLLRLSTNVSINWKRNFEAWNEMYNRYIAVSLIYGTVYGPSNSCAKTWTIRKRTIFDSLDI